MSNQNRQENRPSPEELLERINKGSRGKLTVFLGAAAGVGKTYAMLTAAQERLREGVDIVIGWVESHQRPETEKMAEGLLQIVPLAVEYRGRSLPEMDIDAIIVRNPEIVLVDELAHTNIPGSRHVRRFQDVEEILKTGIHVYTTINIQHIESLNDIVAQITGIIVRETVPDYIIEQADTVKLIDIPPEELIKRLQEGKVYIPDQAKQALGKFFRQGNINALRELSLRFTAARVDKDVNEYMREHSICGPWPVSGRVMVCVSSSPFSAQLIRSARRLAGGLQADWLAVHVEPERQLPLRDKERSCLERNMRLAEELGAKTLTVVGKELTEEVLGVAQSHNISTIVIGKPQHSRWWELVHGSTVDKMIRGSGRMNVYVIRGDAEQEQVAAIKTVPTIWRITWLNYGSCFLMVAGITCFSYFIKWIFGVGLINIALLYQLPVVFSAFWWGRWPACITAICCVLAFEFLFIPSSFGGESDYVHYLWSMITFLIVAFVIGGRTQLLREAAADARVREKSTRALYHFSREIAAITDLKKIAQEMAKQAADVLNRKVTVMLPGEGGHLEVWAENNPPSLGDERQRLNQVIMHNDSTEVAVAVWAYEHGEVSGNSTETLSGAKQLYIPLKSGDVGVGVLSIHIGEKKLTLEERRLVDAWVGLAAMAVERALVAKNKCDSTATFIQEKG